MAKSAANPSTDENHGARRTNRTVSIEFDYCCWCCAKMVMKPLRLIVTRKPFHDYDTRRSTEPVTLEDVLKLRLSSRKALSQYGQTAGTARASWRSLSVPARISNAKIVERFQHG